VAIQGPTGSKKQAKHRRRSGRVLYHPGVHRYRAIDWGGRTQAIGGCCAIRAIDPGIGHTCQTGHTGSGHPNQYGLDPAAGRIHSPGEAVEVEYIRDGQAHTTRVTIAKT